jgi:hypothetical protein
MTKQEALEKYPNLEYMQTMDLVVMRADAISTGDADFKTAIDALLKTGGDNAKGN